MHGPAGRRRSAAAQVALVLSDNGRFNGPAGHSVLAMITSASHSPWLLDCVIGDLEAAGLPAASKVRIKLFTLDNRLFRGRLGRLAEPD